MGIGQETPRLRRVGEIYFCEIVPYLREGVALFLKKIFLAENVSYLRCLWAFYAYWRVY